MISITWLGHSSFELRLDGGETIAIDPWIDGNPKYPSGHKFSRLDTILVSHGHFDHVQGVAGLLKQFPEARVVSSYEICMFFKSRGAANIAPMNKGGSQQAGGVKVTMTHALHSSGIEDEKGNMQYGGDPAGFVIQFRDGRRAYFAGDTAVFGDMSLIREMYQPELCFLPIGDLFTMGPDEAAMAVRLLQPKRVIPMHWGTFPPLVGTPAQLAEKIAGRGTEVWTLEPGKTVSW